jgi:hypothetical protein
MATFDAHPIIAVGGGGEPFNDSMAAAAQSLAIRTSRRRDARHIVLMYRDR